MKQIDCEALYRDGKHYDNQHMNFKDDIPFYLKKAEFYRSPILEIACGTGRITIPIAEKGFEITGLDISEGMLTSAREKIKEMDLKIDFFKIDCRYFNLKKKFKLIFIPFNSFCHIHELSDIEKCFENIRNHLSNDGGFILDIFNPNPEYFLKNPEKKRTRFEYPDPYSDKTVTIYETNEYDKAKQINRIKWYYHIGNEFIREEELNMRIFYPQEIDALLKYNGFEIINKYGDFNEAPFDSDSPKQLIECKRIK
ncbi:MAG: class I SAM-dependent methyltransferase [bacterium]|nr:class I SAM-dependent methyltransferase [bacterium]